jgi:hemolysin activation/secretion protein
MKTEMLLKKLSLFIVLVSLLHAQEEWEPGTPTQEAEGEYEFGKKRLPKLSSRDDSQVLIPQLQGLIIQKQGEQNLLTPGQVTTGHLPEIHKISRQFSANLNQPLTENGLNFLIEVILAHYDSLGHPVVDVVVPEQDISRGTLILEVVEGRVGTVGLQKSKWFKATLLGRGIHLKSGEPILSKSLQRDLDWLSRNPFRQATLFATPGEQPSTGDFLYGLEEQRPWRVYAGYQNNGSEVVGEDRFSTGFNWGNAFGQDHLLNYQFTTGTDTGDFRAHAFSWEIPLHRQQHFLRLSGAKADVQSEQYNLASEGGYRELGLTLGRPLDRWHGLTQEISLGLEWKNIDNFASFGAVSIPGVEVDLWQLHFRYRAAGKVRGSRFDLTGDFIFSPGNVSGQNSDTNFRLFREDAHAQYTILRTSSQWRGKIWNDWTLKLALQAQLSPNKLLPSEQLGLGGYGTVRGYAEREFLADSGYALSAEIGTPVLQWKSMIFQAIGFIDHGTGWRDGEDRQTLSGAGLGLRLETGRAFDGRMDWAVSKEGESQWHLGLGLNF